MTSKAIIIPTCKEFRPWLVNLLATLDTPYPVVLVYNTKELNRYDALGVYKGMELGFDEFFVLHDTCEVKDNSLFHALFEEHAGKSVFLNPAGQMFMNKYTKEDLAKVSHLFTMIEGVRDKQGAVDAELEFNQQYKAHCNPIILTPEFVDNPRREQKFGRENMVLENKYLLKYKGSWSTETLRRAHLYEPR